jgi:hypothetical protein
MNYRHFCDHFLLDAMPAPPLFEAGWHQPLARYHGRPSEEAKVQARSG